jgi:hypothetical protein
MVTWTWDPGKGASFSSNGTSSSQLGTIAIFAVPLRTLTFPSHRPT